MINTPTPHIHRFSHHAMATLYEIIIHHEEADYARQAAHAGFEEIDRLEQELSRFLPNSDISKINSLSAGETARIGPDAFNCLQQCKTLFEDTAGAFDITAGSLMKCWVNPDRSPRNPSQEEVETAHEKTGMQHIQLDENQFSVTLLNDAIHIDLGGFGKGYALDLVSDLLAEWDIENALIHGGRSSVLAKGVYPGKTGWPVTLSHPNDTETLLGRLLLKDEALSSSGLQKGEHIIDPRSGYPAASKIAAWVITPDAATGDALSTALMIMTEGEIEEFFANHNFFSGKIILKNEMETGEPEEKILGFGKFSGQQI